MPAPIAFAALLALGMMAGAAPMKAALLGIDSSGNVYRIDSSIGGPTSGAATLIGASGVSGTLSLGIDGDGVAYTVDGSFHLDTIDKSTGAATIGPLVTGLGTFTTL